MKKSSEKNHTVILFYRYTTIDNPLTLLTEQRTLCENLNLTGRIIIAHEGINGTLEGTSGHIEQYVTSLLSDSRFSTMPIKRSCGTGSAFPRLSIKIKPEIVAADLGRDDINPNEITGDHLSPEQLHQWIENKENIEIVDMRNAYEHCVGHFEKSHLLPMKHFRELPRVLKHLAPLKHKKIVTVCTGGVRCEKASGYLKKKEFSSVYQLDGGIHSYMEKYPNQHFKGKLYVFDQRVTMGFETDSPHHNVVGSCYHCDRACDTYTDCSNLACHHHYISCDQCKKSTENTCSKKCQLIRHFTQSRFASIRNLVKKLSA